MSYAEHGPRIFLSGKLSNDISLIYGDYILPKVRSEDPLKLHYSCMDIRAWSPNALESSRYLRELNEHHFALQAVPFNVIVEGMIDLTSRATNELRNTQRELWKYKLLPLTREQKKYLENFNKMIINPHKNYDSIFNFKRSVMKIEPAIKTFFQEKYGLINANKIAFFPYSDMYLSIYFHFNRLQLKKAHNFLLTNTYIPNKNLFLNLSPNNKTLVSTITSCDELIKIKNKQGHNKQSNICVEYVDAFLQVIQDVCEVGVQTQMNKYENIYDNENRDFDICERSHRKVIIQKDSEIIVLKNELEIKKDELDELQELNKHLQLLLKKENKNAIVLKHNLNNLQENMKIINNKRIDELKDLTTKLSLSECVLDHLKTELGRKCEVCYYQSQEIQKLRSQVKETELLSIENESLTQKIKEMEYLSRKMESCNIDSEQIRNVKQERDMFQKQYHEQSFILADREDEIKKLLILIKQISIMADTREVKMNDIVTNLKYEIQTKNDKISQCEMQLVCMERRINNLINKLESSLNNLDVSMIAYKVLCECIKCEHNCLDMQSALSALNAFMIELEKYKLEKPHHLLEIDNIRCMTCYSQEMISEVTSTDFNTKNKSIQSMAETVSISSNYNDCHSSRKLINVKIQSDDIDTIMTCFKQKAELNEVISSKEIDCVLAIHIKHSIHKIRKISTILQNVGDQHMQIIKEFTKQQQDLRRKDFEITELKQRIAKHIFQRNEKNCIIQKQLKEKMFKEEKMLETIMNERNIEINNHHENLITLENEICSYCEEYDTIKIENSELFNKKNVFGTENDARNEELTIKRNQISTLIQQIEHLKKTINTLKEETNNIDDIKKKLIEQQIKNNNLKNKLIQANKTIAKKTKIVTSLMYEDKINKMILTKRNIKYDTVIMQRHNDIVKLRKENELLCDQLRKTEIKLARSNDIILLLRSENNIMVTINFLRMDLSHLDRNKEKLQAKINYLKNEITSYQNLTASVENKLRVLLDKNETLKTDIEIIKNSNNQLLHVHEYINKQPLKDILNILPKKIYEKVTCLQMKIKENTTKKIYAKQYSKQYPNDKTPEIEDKIKQQQMNFLQQNEKLCISQNIHNTLHPIALNYKTENTEHKLILLEKQHEEQIQEIKNLMAQMKLRNYETKNLQEYVKYLMQEKNNLQNTIKCQSKEYENKLTLLKKKYDNSLNAFRKRHNESVERLQARFEDIMKDEKNPFNVEIWLQRESKTFLNRKTSNKECISKFAFNEQKENEISLMSEKMYKKEKIPSKRFNIENTVAVRKLYSHDLKLRYEYRSFDGKKQIQMKNSELLKSKREKTFDWQREKFIYQCSIYHKSNAN